LAEDPDYVDDVEASAGGSDDSDDDDGVGEDDGDGEDDDIRATPEKTPTKKRGRAPSSGGKERKTKKPKKAPSKKAKKGVSKMDTHGSEVSLDIQASRYRFLGDGEQRVLFIFLTYLLVVILFRC